MIFLSARHVAHSQVTEKQKCSFDIDRTSIDRIVPNLKIKKFETVAKSRRRQWLRPPVLLPGESQGQGSLVGCRLWGRTESDTTEAT